MSKKNLHHNYFSVIDQFIGRRGFLVVFVIGHSNYIYKNHNFDAAKCEPVVPRVAYNN